MVEEHPAEFLVNLGAQSSSQQKYEGKKSGETIWVQETIGTGLCKCTTHQVLDLVLDQVTI